jgi:glycerol-3-phosphate dehydrogenase
VGEIESLIDNEWVVTLSDIVHRRTSMAFSGQVNKKLLKELAHLMASRRGWSSSEVARQIGSITVEEGNSP